MILSPRYWRLRLTCPADLPAHGRGKPDEEPQHEHEPARAPVNQQGAAEVGRAAEHLLHHEAGAAGSPSMTVHATETESRFFANTEVEAEAEAGAGAGSRVGLEGACAGADDAPCSCAARHGGRNRLRRAAALPPPPRRRTRT